MGDLILLFNQIKLVLDGGIVLVLVLADLEEHFNHILNTLVDVCFMENTAELIEDGKGDLRVELFNVLADLLHQTDGNFNAVISGLVKKQQQNLCSEHLVCDLLVNEMGEEGGAAQTDSLVISLVSLAELHNQAVHKQLSNLRQFRVDNGDHGGVDRGEGQTGSLSLHDAATEQAATPDEILCKQLRDDVLDI